MGIMLASITPSGFRSRWFWGVLAIVLVAVGAGCSSSSEEGAGAGATSLTLYSGRSEELVGPIIDRFARESGITVDVRYGDSAELALLIEEEGQRSPADVFYSQAPGAIGFLDANERLRALPDSILDRVAVEFRADDDKWVGITGRVRVVVYDSAVTSKSDLPPSYADLADPKYASRVGIAPENGSFIDFVSELRVVEGDDAAQQWLDALHRNGAKTYANNNAIRDAVARGEVTFGFVNHYYNERARAEDPSATTVNAFFTSGDLGSLVLVTAAGILDSAAHVDAAEKLVAFLVSNEAQEYFAQETFEYPLVTGVALASDLPPLTQVGTPPADFEALGADLSSTRDMIRKAGFTG